MKRNSVRYSIKITSKKKRSQMIEKAVNKAVREFAYAYKRFATE